MTVIPPAVVGGLATGVATVADPVALELLTKRTTTIWGVVAVVVCIALSGFFSSSEIALFSLADHRVDAMVEEELPHAELVRELKSDPHRLLVTILVGNNVVNIAMASITTSVLALYLPPAETVVVTTFGITGLVLLFGESAPKSYAIEHTDSWARRVARPLRLSEYLMYPLVALFDYLTRQVNRLTGTSTELDSPYVTRTELQRLIETGEREGVIEHQERELLLGIFQFRNRIAKEIMQSRLDMAAVEAGASIADAIDRCVNEGHTRLPVYEGTLDDVVGIVELPDLVGAMRTDRTAPVGDVANPVLQIPETKAVDELLIDMRDGGRQVAIVVDEFGTTQGLITLDDVLEEIVGEILEEAERPAIERLDDRSVRVRGDVNVHELNEALDVEVPEGEVFETVAGFVYDSLGRVPEEGEVVEHRGTRIEVERMENTRIRDLVVTRPERPGPGSPDEDGTGDAG